MYLTPTPLPTATDPAEIAPSPDLALAKFVDLSLARANRWTALVITLYVLLFIVGVVAVFVSRFSLGFPWLAVPLALIAGGLGVDALRHQREAERLQRLFESHVQLGQPITEAMLETFRHKLPRKFSNEIDQLVQGSAAFLNRTPSTMQASVTLLSEKSWYTHHFAAICSKKLEIVFWSTLAIALGSLAYAGVTLASSPLGMGAAQCIAAVFLLSLAGGVLRAWQGLHQFSVRCRELHEGAARWLKAGAVDVGEAQMLWTEFQLARASAPLLPAVLQHFYQSRLDEEYLAFRAGGEKWRDSKSRRYYEPLDQT
jgi:hypothetical protein